MTTESTTVVLDTDDRNPAEVAVLEAWQRSVLRRIAAACAVLYGLGWLIAAHQKTAISACQWAFWAAIMAVPFGFAISRRPPVARPTRSLPKAALRQLLIVVAVFSLVFAEGMCRWQASWGEWQPSLGYQVGWLAAFAAGLTACAIGKYFGRKAVQSGGDA